MIFLEAYLSTLFPFSFLSYCIFFISVLMYSITNTAPFFGWLEKAVIQNSEDNAFIFDHAISQTLLLFIILLIHLLPGYKKTFEEESHNAEEPAHAIYIFSSWRTPCFYSQM